MKLVVRRSQKSSLTGTPIFCLDARVELSPEETSSVAKYKLSANIVYSSESSKRHLAQADAHLAAGQMNRGNWGGSLHFVQSMGAMALAAMNLNISVGSLSKGQHIECKSLEEVLGAEAALQTACQALKAFLETAATFDGREVVVDFDEPNASAF